jgi:hypothetical protein
MHSSEQVPMAAGTDRGVQIKNSTCFGVVEQH